jgi:hypothetical protein
LERTLAVNLIEPSSSAIFKSRSLLLASLGYLAFLCLLFWPLFTGDSLNANAQRRMDPPFLSSDSGEAIPYINPWEQDFIQQFSEFEEYQFRSAQHGRFPTWNPHIFMGQPFHANGQSAMLFPTHWIYFLVNPDYARGPMAMVRLWISAMAMFCLLRKFSLGPAAAFAGGSIWSFSSFNMDWLLWPHTNASLCVPVAVLALDYLLLAPSLRRSAAASLCITPIFLAGHPGTEYLCGGLIAVYCITRLAGLALTGASMRRLITAASATVAAIISALLAAAAADSLPFAGARFGSSWYRNISADHAADSASMLMFPRITTFKATSGSARSRFCLPWQESTELSPHPPIARSPGGSDFHFHRSLR